MSLVGTRLHAASPARCLPSLSSSPSPALCVQTRGIKRRVWVKKAVELKKRGSSLLHNQEEGGGWKPGKGQAGLFMPMPAKELKDRLFLDQQSTLNLGAFTANAVAPKNIGYAMEFVPSEANLLHAYGVPRNILVEFRLLSKPCSVIRDVTVSTIEKLNRASNLSSEASRLVLTGPRGCGKSMLLLQAVQHCAANSWIVLYIPRAISLVNSSTPYVYDARTRTYVQPAYSRELLRRFEQINSAALSGLTTLKDFSHGKATFAAGTPLSRIIKYALDSETAAPGVLEEVLSVVGSQKKTPVLLAIDDFQALYRHTSLYRDPRFEGIKPYHLSIPRLLLQYASGRRKFERGAILGALSGSDTTFTLPLELREVLRLPHDRPAGPYVKRRREIEEYAHGLQNIPVPASLQLDEAASLYQVWRRDVAIHSPYNDDVFMTTYTQSSGNARDFVWKGLLGSFTL